MPTKSRHLIRTPKQLAALASAARQEVVDVLAAMGTVSVADLASALGRPADALYFHVRALEQAGLVRRAGHRYRRGRKESLFRTVAPELRLAYEPKSPQNRRGITAIVGSMLRLGIRDFRSAFHPGDAIVSGKHRELWALRKTGRLSATEVTRVNRSIEHLTHALSSPHKRGRLYAVTVLLVPLDRNRSNHAGKAKGPRTK